MLVNKNIATAQVAQHPVSSAFNKLSAYGTTTTDVFSFTGNQAVLASVDHFSAGISGEKRYLLQELGLYQAALCFPEAGGGFGVKGDYYGNSLLNESSLGLAYGRKVGEHIDAGIQFNYWSLKANGYSSMATMSAEGGIIIHASGSFRFGLHIYNPVGSLTNGMEERLPPTYNLGLGYEASEDCFLAASLQKTGNEPVAFNTGIQYKPDYKIEARAGFSAFNGDLYFGIGYLINNIKIDATASVHPHLGITPGLQIIFNSSVRK